MKKKCDILSECITFHYKGFALCHEPKRNYKFYPYEKNFIEQLLNIRETEIEQMKQGIINPECINCCHLKEECSNNSETNSKIKMIELFHWNQCNCACFYCSNRVDTKLKIYNRRNQKGVIEIIPILKKLQKNNLLDNNLRICSGGGEPTILREYPNILKFVIKHNYSIDVLSNGILYEKYIAKALKNNRESKLIVSVDSPNREIFKQIKRIDKYNDVIKNLSRYKKEAEADPHQIIVKYIILKGINDKKEYIDRWIETCANIGIKKFMPSFDFCHNMNKILDSQIDPNIVELYNYSKEKIKEMGPEYILQTHSFLDDCCNKIEKRNKNC